MPNQNKNQRGLEYEVGSDNVFADIGVTQPDVAMLKARLAYVINEYIDHRGFTQAKTAAIIGTDQPKVSALRHGRLKGFSLDRLMRFAMCLGLHLDIRVREVRDSDGEDDTAKFTLETA